MLDCMHGRLFIFVMFLHHAVVDCGTLSAPMNGQLNLTTSTFGSVAIYFCIPPYLLNGSMVRTCQSDGEWSGNEPNCSKCSQPMHVHDVMSPYISESVYGHRGRYQSSDTIRELSSILCLGMAKRFQIYPVMYLQDNDQSRYNTPNQAYR